MSRCVNDCSTAYCIRPIGVLLANESVPMINVLFHNVVVNNPASKPFADGYYCKNVQGVATGTTSPVPPCFQNRVLGQ